MRSSLFKLYISYNDPSNLLQVLILLIKNNNNNKKERTIFEITSKRVIFPGKISNKRGTCVLTMKAQANKTEARFSSQEKSKEEKRMLITLAEVNHFEELMVSLTRHT